MSENPRLAQQRKPFFDYLGANPQERDMFIKAALAEGGTRGLLTNFEQMMNYGNARNFTSTYEIIHSGFFGPVNRGEAQRHVVTSEELRQALLALDEVRRGSNVLDYRTDQGMLGDPNYAKEQNPLYRPLHINGNFFADHPMFGAGPHSWAAKQKALDAAYQAPPLPVPPEPVIVPLTPQVQGAVMNPQISVPIQSTNLVINQAFNFFVGAVQKTLLGAAVYFSDKLDLFDFKSTPYWLAVLGVAGIELYKYYFLKSSNQATIDLANAVEKKLKEVEANAKT